MQWQKLLDSPSSAGWNMQPAVLNNNGSAIVTSDNIVYKYNEYHNEWIVINCTLPARWDRVRGDEWHRCLERVVVAVDMTTQNTRKLMDWVCLTPQFMVAVDSNIHIFDDQKKPAHIVFT